MTPNPYEPRLVRSLDSYLQHGHAASAGRACGADKAFSDFHPLSPGTVHDPAPARIARRFASGGRTRNRCPLQSLARALPRHSRPAPARCAPLTYELLWRVAQTLLTRADLLSRMQVRGVITFLLQEGPQECRGKDYDSNFPR